MAFVLVLNVWNGCNSNNIMNRVKQAVSCKVLFNVGINELIMQEMLLKNLKKQVKLWKLHKRTSQTWAFFKVNNNQHVDLGQSQVMRCIVWQSGMVGPNILALHTRCHKGFIMYHKVNFISTMKKQMEQVVEIGYLATHYNLSTPRHTKFKMNLLVCLSLIIWLI